MDRIFDIFCISLFLFLKKVDLWCEKHHAKEMSELSKKADLRKSEEEKREYDKYVREANDRVEKCESEIAHFRRELEVRKLKTY